VGWFHALHYTVDAGDERIVAEGIRQVKNVLRGKYANQATTGVISVRRLSGTSFCDMQLFEQPTWKFHSRGECEPYPPYVAKT
jgi:hypothetical protein